MCMWAATACIVNANTTTIVTLHTNVDGAEIANPKHSTISGRSYLVFFVVCNNHIFTLLRYILLHSGRNEYVHFPPPAAPLSLSLRVSMPSSDHQQLPATSNVCCFIIIFHFNLSHSAHNILGGRIECQKLDCSALVRSRPPLILVCAPNIFHCLRIFVEINKRGANDGNGRNEKKKVSACSVQRTASGGIGRSSVCYHK